MRPSKRRSQAAAWRARLLLTAILAILCRGEAGAAPQKYQWNVSGSGTWTTPGNWTPARTTPAGDDVLTFGDFGITNSIVDGVVSETIGQLILIGGVNLSMTGSSPTVVLTIAGGEGTDLSVPAGTRLNRGSDAAPVIHLKPRATGRVGGIFDAGVQTFANDIGSLVFAAGSTANLQLPPGTSPFGTTSLRSVIFLEGSTVEAFSAGDPFGAAAPDAVVEFEPGSLYRHRTSSPPSMSGRTYGNFTMMTSGGTEQIVAGKQPAVVYSLTGTSGTLRIRLSQTHVRGRLSGNDIHFDSNSPQAVVFDGSGFQDITGNPTFGPHTHVRVDHPRWILWFANSTINGSLTLDGGDVLSGLDLTFSGPSQLVLTEGVLRTAGSGRVDLGPLATCTSGSPASYVDGKVRKHFAPGGATAFTFPVGDDDTFTPVDLSFPSIDTEGHLTVSTWRGDHYELGTSGFDADETVNRAWFVSNSGLGFAPCDATFHFAPGDVDPGLPISQAVVRRFTEPSTWSATTPGVRTATSTQATGIASFGDFQIGYSAVTGVDESPRTPTATALHAPVPSPFSNVTRIAFDLPRESRARLEVFDMHGRLVQDLRDEVLPAGRHTVAWNGTDRSGSRLGAGIYLIRLSAGDFRQARRVAIVP